MATSSIKKEFHVIDKNAFKKMVKEINKMPMRNTNPDKKTSLNKGAELLKQFSFH